MPNWTQKNDYENYPTRPRVATSLLEASLGRKTNPWNNPTTSYNFRRTTRPTGAANVAPPRRRHATTGTGRRTSASASLPSASRGLLLAARLRRAAAARHAGDGSAGDHGVLRTVARHRAAPHCSSLTTHAALSSGPRAIATSGGSRSAVRPPIRQPAHPENFFPPPTDHSAPTAGPMRGTPRSTRPTACP